MNGIFILLVSDVVRRFRAGHNGFMNMDDRCCRPPWSTWRSVHLERDGWAPRMSWGGFGVVCSKGTGMFGSISPWIPLLDWILGLTLILTFLTQVHTPWGLAQVWLEQVVSGQSAEASFRLLLSIISSECVTLVSALSRCNWGSFDSSSFPSVYSVDGLYHRRETGVSTQGPKL